MRDNLTSATTAGMVFKCQVRKFFKEKRDIKLSLIHCDPDAGITNYIYSDYIATDNGTIRKRFTLPGLKELFFVDKTKTPLGIGTYFRP